MDFTKKVNDFGLFSNVLAVNNDIMESVSTTKTEDEKEILMIAAHITSKAIEGKVKRGAFESLIAGMGASDSTNITLVTPDIKDIKIFIEAVIKTAEDGNMCHMKDYMHETGNNIPQDIWDYKLTTNSYDTIKYNLWSNSYYFSIKK